MENIQPLFIEKIVDFIDNLVHRAKVKINGEYRYYEVYKTIKRDNVIRKYVYIEDETGVIEEAQLLTNTDDPLVIKKYEIEKELDGLVLTFEIEINVTENDLGYVE